MINVFDVADYFLSLADEDCGDGISNLKLQKLCYYAQGFCLAINGERLFQDDIEAWQYGPAVRVLYEKYDKCDGNRAAPLSVSEDLSWQKIPDETKDLLDEVYQTYGQYSAWKLRDMTHVEPPWTKCTVPYCGGME